MFITFEDIEEAPGTVKSEPSWLILFSDMLFIASGYSEDLRELQYAFPLAGVWLKERVDGKNFIIHLF